MLRRGYGASASQSRHIRILLEYLITSREFDMVGTATLSSRIPYLIVTGLHVAIGTQCASKKAGTNVLPLTRTDAETYD